LRTMSLTDMSLRAGTDAYFRAGCERSRVRTTTARCDFRPSIDSQTCGRR
jgi:hypothetical protein